jgi:hypothetical protein
MADTGEQIDLYAEKSRCKEHTGLTFEELIGLTGMYGVYPHFTFGNARKNSHITYDPKAKIVTVYILIGCIDTLYLTINLNDEQRFINFDSLETEKKNIDNLALLLVKDMVRNCMKHDIEKITLTAARGGHYTGDVVWALAAFIPDPPFKRYVDPLLIEYNDNYKMPEDEPISTLYELLICKNGRELWRSKGHWWAGSMTIDKSIPYGNALLEQALKRKGLH